MTPPVLRSSPNGGRKPDVPNGVSVGGLASVKCVLTEEARAQDCVVIKKISPAMDQAILDWLSGCTWTPVTFHGKPMRVAYVFNIWITVPGPQ